MKKYFKAAASLVIAVVMVFSQAWVSLADDYTVEDAYEECKALYPEFVEAVTSRGVSEDQIISLLKTVQANLISRGDVTEDNFQEAFQQAVLDAFTLRKHIAIRDALVNAYPDAAISAQEGVFPEEFRPLYNTMKTIIFEHNLINSDDSDDSTEATSEEETETEPATEKQTETTTATEKQTETTTATEKQTVTTSATEKETEAQTETGIDAQTETGTEAETETSSKKTTGGGGGSGTGGGGRTETETTTAGTTEAETESGTGSGTQTSTETGSSDVFKDLDGAAWAKEAIYDLAGKGFISGYGDGTFKPSNNITRAEFAKIIVMVAGMYDESATCGFDDVNSGDWYYSYVASAKNAGLITGRSDTVFDPNASITRADISVIVYRYLKSVSPEFANGVSAAEFADESEIPSYAKEAVTALSGAGIINGMGDNRFSPLSPATRAQSAKIVCGAIKAVIK